jgi:hypothetical protein
VSAGLDLTVDSLGRQVRVEFRSGGWVLRGGVTGRETTWVRTAAEAPGSGAGGGRPGTGSVGGERSTEAAGFAGVSPGLLVAAARLLGLAPGGRARLRAVAVSGDALATRVVEQGWELVEVGPRGGLSVSRYRVAALDTGETGEVHLTGDVVLAAPGVELAALSSPPGS